MIKNNYMPEGMSANRSNEWTATPAALERAMELGIILEAPVTLCDGNLNLTVDLGVIQGIIPRNEVVLPIGGEPIKDIAIISRVGKPVCFKILGFDRDDKGNERAILSRRAAQYECLNDYLLTLDAGDIIPARITNAEHFGAFVDVGCGINSMIPLDSISVSRISHPSDRFCVGMPIKVVVKSVDPVTSRIYVSHKELLGTWEENAENFQIGQTVVGIVRSVEDYGIFIELAPNLAGLAEYRGDVKVGQCVSVYIKNIIPERMKIKLVVIDACPDRPESRPTRPGYYILPEQEHIDYWRYSPVGTRKLIQSVFVEENLSRIA